jgi:hypothetical protein
MKRRTNTASKASISFDRPNARGKFVFPTAEPSNQSKIIIPENSRWRTELHWHETHDEYVHVRKGRIRVTIGDVTRESGPEDGDLKMPKFTIHEFVRAGTDCEGDKEAGDVEVFEWTNPGLCFRSETRCY